MDFMHCARVVAARAHCPYSHFHVGCCVVDREGNSYEGCNVENASYGLTCCAERSAIFNAVSSSNEKPEIVQVYITCPDLADGFDAKYSMPCGACRQVLAEFASPDCVVHIDRVGEFSLGELLPNPFKL